MLTNINTWSEPPEEVALGGGGGVVRDDQGDPVLACASQGPEPELHQEMYHRHLTLAWQQKNVFTFLQFELKLSIIILSSGNMSLQNANTFKLQNCKLDFLQKRYQKHQQ